MKRLFLLIMSVGILMCGCKKQPDSAQTQNQQPISISQSVNTYFISGSLENNEFTATQKVNYVNQEQQELKELYFHLYPNIYKERSMVEDATMETKYPNGFMEGGIEISSVSMLDTKLDTETKDRLIKISLPTPLAPMESIILTFEYKTKLPNTTARMGYFNDCYNLTSFYPVAAVFENGKWQIDKYNSIGDPFFTDMADYYVTLSLPAGFTVASTGTYTKKEEGNIQQLSITANNVRDMAIVASPHFKVLEGNVDGTTVRSYYLNSIDDAVGQSALNTAMESLHYFNTTFGKYPYSDLDVVGCEFTGGGMEYPGLTLITKDVYDTSSLAHLEWIVAHENAHQWWYGLVGNDPINHSFIDESLTEYSTLSYIQAKYDKETADAFKNRLILTPFAKYNHILTNEMTIDRSTMKYKSSLELSLLVYNKGCMMYMDMENIMGKDKLIAMLKSYYEKYAYNIVTPKTWKEHLKASYEYDWDTFFKKWLG